jgi:2',3'-cyclic-nucleotide 2'-phosphodiesterase/3'-nucleotidase
MKMKKGLLITVLVLSVAALTFFTACQTGPAMDPPKSFELKLVSTSDVHGAIFPYDFINDKPAATSLAQVMTYVNEERAVLDQDVVLLDNGDILQGQPVVYYYNFEDTGEAHIQAQVMNYMGYEAGSVGNHDIEAGHPVYDQIVKEFDFPWLAANAVHADTGEQYFEPYTVIHRNGAKIVVLGMITPGIATWLPEEIWTGIRFDRMVETAEKWVPIVMEKENPDLLVGLFHSGVDYTYSGGTKDEVLNKNASVLVPEFVPGFDVIFTGHDHADTNMTVTDPSGKEVVIVGALNAARSVAVANVSFTYDDAAKSFRTSVMGETVMMEGVPADADFLAEFQGAYDSVKEYVAKPIGNFTKTISTKEAMFGDSAFVDLIHRIQLEITDADVSFAAPLSFIATINEGDVFVRDMFNLYKYENLLYTMELSGKEIKDFLEFSYDGWMNTMENTDDNLLNFKRDDAGELIWNDRYNSYDLAVRYYNYDSAAGINYTVDVSKPAGERLEITGFSDGRSFSMADTYLVAINSYRGTGGGGHLTKGAGLTKAEIDGRLMSSTIKDLRYYLMKWIEDEGTVEPAPIGNWSLKPVEWTDAAAKRDFALIYPE